MTDRIRLAAQALLDHLDKYGVAPGWGVHKDALRRALAEHAEEPGYDAGMLDGHRLGFGDGVEAAAKEAMDLWVVCQNGNARDIVNAAVNRIRYLAPPVPSGPREGACERCGHEAHDPLNCADGENDDTKNGVCACGGRGRKP
jgi:hypothetical protein